MCHKQRSHRKRGRWTPEERIRYFCAFFGMSISKARSQATGMIGARPANIFLHFIVGAGLIPSHQQVMTALCVRCDFCPGNSTSEHAHPNPLVHRARAFSHVQISRLWHSCWIRTEMINSCVILGKGFLFQLRQQGRPTARDVPTLSYQPSMNQPWTNHHWRLLSSQPIIFIY